jgi:hypothetical protein
MYDYFFTFSEVWEQRPMVLRRHKPHYNDGLLSTSALDTIFREVLWIGFIDVYVPCRLQAAAVTKYSFKDLVVHLESSGVYN